MELTNWQLELSCRSSESGAAVVVVLPFSLLESPSQETMTLPLHLSSLQRCLGAGMGQDRSCKDSDCCQTDVKRIGMPCWHTALRVGQKRSFRVAFRFRIGVSVGRQQLDVCESIGQNEETAFSGHTLRTPSCKQVVRGNEYPGRGVGVSKFSTWPLLDTHSLLSCGSRDLIICP
eukprot:882625-Rhodomonas_salina.2